MDTLAMARSPTVRAARATATSPAAAVVRRIGAANRAADRDHDRDCDRDRVLAGVATSLVVCVAEPMTSAASDGGSVDGDGDHHVRSTFSGLSSGDDAIVFPQTY
jgi:hypothetical protein